MRVEKTEYRLKDNTDQLVSSSGLTPVLAEGDHQVRDRLSIQKDCGSDNICVPDLSVRTQR